MWFIEVAFVSERGESGEPYGSTEVTEGVFKASCVRRVQTHEKNQKHRAGEKCGGADRGAGEHALLLVCPRRVAVLSGIQLARTHI